MDKNSGMDARERIIKAATQLFSQKGYDATRVSDIAVQTPNFGHYAAITSGFKSFLMIALWYSLGGLSLRLP